MDSEVRRIRDPSRLFIGGFAQGSITAMAAFLMNKYEVPIGGFIGICGFLSTF